MDPAVLSAMHHANTAPTYAPTYPEQANESPSRANSTEGLNDKLPELVDCTNPSAITADSGHEPQLHLVHHDSEPKGIVPYNDPDHEFNATHLSTNTVDRTNETHAQLGVKHFIAICSARVNAPNPHPRSNLYVSEVKTRVLLPENPSREIEAPDGHTDLGTGRAPPQLRIVCSAGGHETQMPPSETGCQYKCTYTKNTDNPCSHTLISWSSSSSSSSSY
jgi:hypothetical protein